MSSAPRVFARANGPRTTGRETLVISRTVWRRGKDGRECRRTVQPGPAVHEMVVSGDGPEAQPVGSRRDGDQPLEPGRLLARPADLRKVDTKLHAVRLHVRVSPGGTRVYACRGPRRPTSRSRRPAAAGADRPLGGGRAPGQRGWSALDVERRPGGAPARVEVSFWVASRPMRRVPIAPWIEHVGSPFVSVLRQDVMGHTF